MHFLTLVLCVSIAVRTFLFWEFIAWVSHKICDARLFVTWHKSHHSVHVHKLRFNDLLVAVFGVPFIGLIYYATLVFYNPYVIAVGSGIFSYGLFYFIFHDVIVHQRIKWRPRRLEKYLQRPMNVHYTHRRKHTRKGCEALGFLIASRKYEPTQFGGNLNFQKINSVL